MDKKCKECHLDFEANNIQNSEVMNNNPNNNPSSVQFVDMVDDSDNDNDHAHKDMNLNEMSIMSIQSQSPPRSSSHAPFQYKGQPIAIHDPNPDSNLNSNSVLYYRNNEYEHEPLNVPLLAPTATATATELVHYEWLCPNCSTSGSNTSLPLRCHMCHSAVPVDNYIRILASAAVWGSEGMDVAVGSNTSINTNNATSMLPDDNGDGGTGTSNHTHSHTHGNIFACNDTVHTYGVMEVLELALHQSHTTAQTQVHVQRYSKGNKGTTSSSSNSSSSNSSNSNSNGTSKSILSYFPPTPTSAPQKQQLQLDGHGDGEGHEQSGGSDDNPSESGYRVWFCSTIPHISQNGVYGSHWSCGYRNIQMLCTSLMQVPQMQSRLFLGCGQVPGIAGLQMWVEKAWEEGFDVEVTTAHRLYICICVTV